MYCLCKLGETTRDNKYENFISEHDCLVNHSGSTGSMEAIGVVECFQSSAKDCKLRYTQLIGDGDSKTYPSILAADPYPGITVEKLECIGHIQKRIGSRFRNLRTKHKEALSDGKRISGRGCLTEKLINTLQNLYGIALRQNVNKTVHEMKVAIGAVLYHSTEFKETENCHLYCPRGTDTWCKYWKDKLNNEKQFVEKPGMPIAVYDIIKPIFLDLSNDTLLRKCIHGKTQNANEALNNLIWTKCPKNVYVEREVLEMGVSSAVINFNNGACGILNVFHGANMEPGYFTKMFCMKKDREGITTMNMKSSDELKTRRKKLRAIRKKYIDVNKEKKSVFYEAGAI